MYPLSLAAFLSGAAALAYQIAWTRKILSVTSAAVWAQALIVAVFLAGLALGARLAAARAPQLRRPLVGYAAAEAGALLLALASGSAVDASPPLRAAGGLALQLAGIGLFLLAATTLLGASIPFLMAGIPADPARSGQRAGLLYGVNTLGALAGTLATGWWSIEQLGIEGSLRAAAVLAALAAALALVSSRPAAPRAAHEGAPGAAGSEPLRWQLAALVGGFVGVGAEVLWTRLLSLVVPNTVYAFAESTAAVLAGVGIAGLLAARVSRCESALRLGGMLATAAAVLLASGPLLLVALCADEATQLALARGEPGPSLRIVGLMMIPAATAVGASLPLIVVIQRSASAAATFGRLYACNAVGCVAGSLLVGFVLLPGIGIAWTLRILVLAALALALLFLEPRIRERFVLGFVGFGSLAAALSSFAIDLPLDVYRLRIHAQDEIREFREGIQSDVMVTDHRNGRRRLWINSVWVAGTGQTHGDTLGTPHQLLGHLPALLVEKPRRALGIALGTGQTFASVLAHGVERFDCVEINSAVIALSRAWFREENRGFLDDPRVAVHHDDGRAFLRSATEPVDLLVLEPLQSWSAGTSALYSRDFYQEAERVLASGGVVAQWLPLYGQGEQETRAMVRSALDVFPQASLWLDGFDGILILGKTPYRLDPAALARRIRERGLEQQIPGVDRDGLLAVLPLFVMGPLGLEAWARGSEAITDDRPSLEFAAARRIGRHDSQAILTSLLERMEPPARYLAEGTSPAQRREVEQAALVQRALIEEHALAERSPAQRALVLEAALARVPGSTHLAWRYRNTILEWARSPGADAAAIYRRGLAHQPDFGEALVNTALLEMQSGHRAAAIALLERARGVDRTRVSAEGILAKIQASDVGR